MNRYEHFKVGDTTEIIVRVTDELIAGFANISGDKNPVHLDEAFASTTVFGRRIAHGMLLASFISAVLANNLPGKGTIYLSQSIRFNKPVYIDDIITVRVSIISLRAEKKHIELETICINEGGDTVVEGIALTKYLGH